ncbi:MAG: anhydro-N-acetylmuramic acid kinase [Methylococcales bacterium]
MSYYIGLMSGTSLDGIDAALVDFTSSQPQLITCYYQAFNTELQTRLKNLCYQNTVNLPEFGSLDCELGTLFAQSVAQLLTQANLPATNITAIGSHGQTIYHSPHTVQPFSLQIGDPNRISKLSGIPVVADLRRADIAAGGQGAPLVPAFHQTLFQSDHESRVIVNIGGIANITVLPTSTTSQVIGFDTGPGNTLLDFWAHKHTGLAYDEDSRFGRSGKLCGRLLETMLKDEYFSQPAPKSTGQEHFSAKWLNTMLKQLGQSLPAADVQTTLYELTARTIADAIQSVAPDTQRVLTCGGGVHNTLLMERLETNLNRYTIESTAALGADPDWIEAMAFAWLAHCFVENIPSNLPSVTGANRPVVLGGYYLPG